MRYKLLWNERFSFELTIHIEYVKFQSDAWWSGYRLYTYTITHVETDFMAMLHLSHEVS